MTRLGDQVFKVRSKNAGPFWLTLDIFCGDLAVFSDIAARLQTETVAALFGAEGHQVRRFDIADLAVIKFSIPRPTIQGSRWDRDMHGAQWAHLLEELPL